MKQEDPSRRKPTAPPPGAEPEETGHLDDAVIGQAFRRSALAAVLLAVVGGGAYLYFNRKPAPPPTQITAIAAPVAANRAAAEMPTVRFTDVTAASGITFRHYNGATGDKLLPETMGGGVSVIDFDRDGDQDLVFVNGRDWPWAKAPRQPQPTPALYRNDGSGRFTDITAGSGLDVSLQGMSAAVGDFDNDGLDDLYF